MALTRVTTSVISSNVITSDTIGNNIIQERHIQSGALTANAMSAEARADFVETRLNANLNIVQSNVVATQSNVNTVQSNVNVVQDNVLVVDTKAINYATTANALILDLGNQLDDTDTRQATNVSIFTDAFTGTNAAIVDTEARVNANLDIVQDNVASILDGTSQFTGDVTMQQALTVQGNLYVIGAQVDLGVGSAQIDDAVLTLAANTPTDTGLAVDSGILINRGANDNVFFGFAAYGDHIDFIFTDAPAGNVNHYPIQYIDVHANTFGTEGTTSTSIAAFYDTDDITTGLWWPGTGIIGFTSQGTNQANILSSGNIQLTSGSIEHVDGNRLDLSQSSQIILNSKDSIRLLLDTDNNGSSEFFGLFKNSTNPALSVDSAIFSVRQSGEVFILDDASIKGNANVTLDAVVSNAVIGTRVFEGTVGLQANDSATLFSAYANDFITYTRLNANLNSTSDNIAAVISNTNLVQDNVSAITGGATLLTPFTNVNTATGTSNVFFIGKNAANDSNVLVVTLDGVRQHPTIDWVGNYANDTVQFVDATIPSGTIVSITSLNP